jgi:excisionase family DNA binding protein
MGTSEFAHALGVHPNTVYRWVQEGRVRPLQVGRRWRFGQSQIAEACGIEHSARSTEQRG